MMGKVSLPITAKKWKDLTPDEQAYLMKKSPDRPYLFLQDAVESMALYAPALYKLVCPRRYHVPGGYPNPKLFGALWGTHLIFPSMDEKDINKTMVDCTLTIWKLIECGMPLYFVGSDFIEALSQSDPPRDMLLSELQWPFDALTFVLPEKFAMRYFNRRVMFVSCARQRARGLIDPPEAVTKVGLSGSKFGMEPAKYIGGHGVFFHASVLFGDKPVDYAASSPDKETVSALLDTKDFVNSMRDAPYIDEQVTPEEDRAIIRKITSIGIWLLLAMTAGAGKIEAESISRPAKMKHGHVKDELWFPRWIGRTYRHPSPPLGGTHSSPRMHLRCGHWTNQVHGPQRSLRKLIWIEPTWVNSEEEVKEDTK